MTLAELTAEEDRLLAIIGSVAGSMEQKFDALRRHGVFRDYARVHAEYAELASRGDAEALKRAVFLQWFAQSEPACFTGLWELAPAAERRVLELLDRLAAADAMDSELRWMLPYYHAITDFAFDGRDGLPSLDRWLRENASAEFPGARTDDAALAGRGQLSAYWHRPGSRER
ncbi:MAG: hypothetical protein M3Y87_04100 [Myxococcota bacterium]|nr:hypothetical protein [Myxococcota bacterium]